MISTGSVALEVGLGTQKPRSFAVSGLGTFGTTVASELARFGAHVLGIDTVERNVNRVADTLAEAVIADRRDEQALREAGVGNYDVAVAVSVALELPHWGARAFGRAGPGLDLGLHDPIGRVGQHLSHEVTIGLLLNQLDQRHSLFGHRHLRCRFQVSQPEPFPKIGDDRQRHPRPSAALRRRLRARPPTPCAGTLPA
jgi:hypothetical protein